MSVEFSPDTLDMLKAGLDRIDQGLTLFDADLRLVFVNERACDLLDLPSALSRPGTPFEELIRWNAVRGEYGAGDVNEMVAERVRTARLFRSHTLERVRPNGVVLNVSGWPLPGGGFATLYSDITVQRRRELELERRILKRTEELRQSEERLRSIASEVPAGIAYLDIDGIFRFVNRRFARAYQLDPKTIVGRSERDVLSRDTWERVQPFFARALKGEAQTFDIPIHFPDGRTLETRTFLRPDRAGDGIVNGFYVLTVNITREKMAANALAQAQKMETLGQLSSGIAHDFNNLLTIILGNLKPLAERIGDDDLRRDMVEPAIRATRRGADLMRRLLAVARRQPLSPVPIDLCDCARTIADLVRPSLGEDTKLVLDYAEDTPLAYADPALLETSLINLVINAADAIGGKGTITIGMRDGPGETVVVTVADDGEGMDDVRRARIFEPFYSTKPGQERSGLGLTMVQGFVSDSGGGVTVESQPGQGTIFTLTLPAADHSACAGLTEKDDGVSGAPPTFPLTGKLLLLVDDEEAVRHVLRRDLVAAGAHVIEASNGVEALDLLESVPGIASVVSDVSMPVMGGLALAVAIRRNWPNLPVALLSGYGAEAMDGALPEGVPLMHKPVDAAGIAATLAIAAARVDEMRIADQEPMK
ncbi:PAS-domain containing protein [Notoacmeibacter sp. MSK16QG-6]|uniref:hybrid sensor histidine kinase/response regulator n=1 Tax=Notoacmeibacter sp. MSK16QG-6 TaxID=2957982 RepID=UPI00209ED898|nr:PAS-domain containing protein [Notoacmeibacter sp. MSK16QG-6]MCP1200281.1 PAS-domain containing protein [Notoacmeibacter sp. MSK16QG-6]